ncbi:MAG TPA: tetratricopeptide repeat protein [Planctomycetota bacterium]|nr:tetratricopeptide repeat protein [Planctomycetota bacterium]
MGKGRRLREAKAAALAVAAAVPSVPAVASTAALAAPTATPAFPWSRAWLFLLTIAAVALAVYANAFAGDFVLDDVRFTHDEPFQLRTLTELLSPFWHSGNRQLMMESLAIDHLLWGRGPQGYHAFNVLVHILASWTLFGVIRRTLLSDRLRERFGAHAAPLALAATLLFVVHPLNTTAVTYIYQRGHSLMGLFQLLVFYCAIRAHGSPHRGWWGAAAIVACVYGFDAKLHMVATPLLVLLYEMVFFGGSPLAVAKRSPVLYLGFLAILVGPLAQYRQPDVGDVGVTLAEGGRVSAEITPYAYAISEWPVIVHYLRLAVVPEPLCLDYAWPLASGLGAALPYGLALSALGIAAIMAWRRNPEVTFVGAWFFLNLAPTSSILPRPDLAFEHRMYVPLMALAPAAVLAAAVLARRVRWLAFLDAKRPAIAALAIVVVGYGALTIRRNQDYGSYGVMSADSMRKSPNNPRARINYGNSLRHAGLSELAIVQYREALRLKPDYWLAFCNIGAALADLGRHDEAIAEYEKSNAIHPDFAEAHYNIGVSLIKLGRPAEALAPLRKALELKPFYPEAAGNIGNALVLLDRPGEAEPPLRQALAMEPEFAEAHYNLGNALMMLGRRDDAEREYRAAVRTRPDYAEAHHNLALSLAMGGKATDADVHLCEAIRLKPDYDQARRSLERLRAR